MANPYINYTINLCRFATKMINKITRAIKANKNYTIKLSGVQLKKFNVNVKNKITLKSSKSITDELLEYFQLFCDTYTHLSRCKVNSSKYKNLLTLTQKLKDQFIEFLISSRDYNGGTSEMERVRRLDNMLPEPPTHKPLVLPEPPTHALPVVSTQKSTGELPKRKIAIAIPRKN